MKNLAGLPEAEASKEVLNELLEAKIDININNYGTSEVKSFICGKLNKFEFVRAWYYYIVKGYVPLKIADEIYKSKYGKDIRVRGDCTRITPIEGVKWFTKFHRIYEVFNEENLKQLMHYRKSDSEYMRNTSSKLLEEYLFSDNPDVEYNSNGYIDLYHIDSQEGLNTFASFVKDNNLTGDLE